MKLSPISWLERTTHCRKRFRGQVLGVSRLRKVSTNYSYVTDYARETRKRFYSKEANGEKDLKSGEVNLSIDRSNLATGQTYGLEVGETLLSKRTPQTPLLRELRSAIDLRGPITVSEFMSLALGHAKYGYYMRKDVFGAEGDFTTSPEISQLFGELIGIWCVANWESMGRPRKVRVVELGPGRGTLMLDLLRACSKFDDFVDALIHGGGVQMVETSPALRRKQKLTLNCEDIKTQSKGHYKLDKSASKRNIRGQRKRENATRNRKRLYHEERQEKGFGVPLSQFRNEFVDESKLIPVEWLSRFDEVDDDQDEQVPLLIVAQELFDALPIHQFEMTSKGEWSERLVDVNLSDEELPSENQETPSPKYDDSENQHLRFVLSQSPTPASKVLLHNDFHIKPSPTEPEKTLSQCEPGDCVEVSAVSAALIQSISRRITFEGGAALIIDYGNNFASKQSLRGIKGHEFVHPLQEPGKVDLSADVNFEWLKKMALYPFKRESNKNGKNELVRIHGPVTQGEFLTNMGIQYRVSALLEQISEEDTESLNRLYQGYQRLVEAEDVIQGGMGKSYKAMALTSAPPKSRLKTISDCAGFTKLR